MADSKNKTECYLRRAQPKDVDLLYNWVNDHSVRQSAFDSHEISYDEHVKWFDKMMRDPDQVQYILIVDDIPAGQVRLTISGDEAEIDYSISNSVRGLGYGNEIIRLAIESVRVDYPVVKKLIGRIRPSNVASYYCFVKNDFEECFQQLEYDLTRTSIKEKIEMQKTT